MNETGIDGRIMINVKSSCAVILVKSTGGPKVVKEGMMFPPADKGIGKAIAGIIPINKYIRQELKEEIQITA